MKFTTMIEQAGWNKKMVIARIMAGLNQQEAAEKIGTSQAMVWAWEKGRNTPRVRSRKAIARAYGVDYKELFAGLMPE